MTRLDRSDPTISELAKLKPHSLRIELADGTERKMEVPRARNKWERLSKTLEALAWDRIEALDKDGGVLGIVDREDEAELDTEDDERGTDFARGVKLGASVAVDVMRTTQKEVRQMFQAQLDGQAHVMTLMTQAMHSVSDSYTLAMRVQAANATGGEGDEMSNMLKMAMGLQAMARSTTPPSPVVNAPPANAKSANAKVGS